MLIHPQFDPIAFSIGPFGVHWYGLMYLVGFAAFWALGRLRARESWRGFTQDDVEDMLFYGVFGVILGGRLGYCLFYQPEYYLANPMHIFYLWEGGMSAHGGLLGVLAVMWGFSAKKKISIWKIADFAAPMVPIGLMAGRIGNFINGELWGRPASSDFPLAMVFPQAPDLLPRHPSQLYEAALEGLVLFVVLWTASRKPKPSGFIAGLFAVGYGTARFTVEFFREPDSFLGLQALGLSRGQWLTIPLFIAGAALIIWSLKKGYREE